MVGAAKPIGLWRRDDSSSYYIYRRFPLDLVAAAGKRFYKRSLRTSELSEATKRCNAETVEFDKLCDELRTKLNGAVPRTALWNMEQARQRVRTYVEETDARRQAEFSAGLSTDNTRWRADCLEESQSLLAAYSDRNAEDTQEAICIAARVIFGSDPGDGLELPGSAPYASERDTFGCDGPLRNLSTAQHSERYDLIWRAMLEVERRTLAVLRSGSAQRHFDHAFSPLALRGGSPVDAKLVTLGELSKGYLAEYPNRRSVRAKRLDKVTSDIALIVEFFGEATALQNIDRQRCREFRDLLSELPSNLNKHFRYRKRPLADVAAEAKLRGLSALKYDTQLGYIATLKDLVKWARLEGTSWPVDLEEIAPIGERPDPDDARDPFSIEQLKSIFGAPLYRAGGMPPKHKHRVANATRCWAPLVGLFTGMRLNEICQLDTADVGQTGEGIWFIDVNDNAPDKTLKRPGSARRIPLHPALLGIGFRELVEGRRERGDRKLFPELVLSDRGYYSEDVSKWFNRTFLPGIGAKTAKTGFHSFRHAFRDALRRAEVPNEISWAIGGWSSGEGVAGRYGTGNLAYTIEQLSNWMRLVSYPGLDLSHLPEPRSQIVGCLPLDQQTPL